jgi:hypothetical protein
MGWENVFHCEWMEFPRKVLDYYWPNADSHIDICKTDFKKYANKIDILTGGFPCQPFSMAGKRKGTEDERYLWGEMLRAVQEIKPKLSSQKMSLVSQILTADWYSSRCALIWKLKGTKFSRLLFQLQPKTHRTDEIDVGLLLPTPTAMDSSNATATMKSSQVKEGSMHSVTLNRYILNNPLLNTPTCSDKNGGCTRSNPKLQLGSSLVNEMHGVLKQPTGKTSQLNPRFVAEMMGFPPNWTELPFLNGGRNQSKVTEMPSFPK